MLILPADRGVDWTHPPWITAALILINCIVFFGFQAGDGARYTEAYHHYVGSGLGELESRAYDDYLRKRDDHERLIERQRLRGASLPQFALYLDMTSDTVFMVELRANRIITPRDEAFAQWRVNRDRHEALQRGIVSRVYAFDADRLVTWFTSPFLHADLGHLFGNMLFLFIAGFLVERILGHGWYLAGYLFGAMSGSLLWALYSQMPVIGASAAVSGVMGMYASLFGLRRIRVFYWILIYFDYVRTRAIYLLPIWVAKEIYVHFNGTGSVAYMAHIGGFVGGGLFGLLCTQVFRCTDSSFLDERERRITRDGRYESALDAIARLDHDGARQILETLRHEDPDNIDVLTQLYAIERRYPGDTAYHQAAGRLFHFHTDDRVTIARIHDVYQDYCRLAKPGPRLLAPTIAHLAALFILGRHVREANELVVLLTKIQPGHPQLPAMLARMRSEFFP